MARIADNIFLLVTMAVSMASWLIAFVGACVFRRGLTGGAWWIVVYELLLVLGTGAVLVTNTYSHYRMMILTFLAASIAMLTYQLDYALPTYKFTPGYRGGAGAYAAGYILLIITQFLWVIIFGSEPESYIGKFAPSYYGNSVGIVGQMHQTNNNLQATPQQQQQPQQYEMTGDKTILPDSNTAYNSPNNTHQQQQYNTSPIPTTANRSMTPVEPVSETPRPNNVVEYREKVQALHAYQANPDDPNELSFAKGETLEIVDRNGNWWQARKSDGTIGIIPSNYFGASA